MGPLLRRGEAQPLGGKDNGPLIRVEMVALIPIQPVEAKGRAQSKNRGQSQFYAVAPYPA